VFTARYVLSTQCIYVLCGSEHKQRLFHYTALRDFLINKTERVYCAVGSKFLNKIQAEFPRFDSKESMCDLW
jgi:hypothetical protein